MAENGSPPFSCRVVTPQNVVFDDEVNHIVLPGKNGKFGVLAGHTPYLAALDIGEIKVEGPRGTRFIACSGGYAEIGEGSVKVLAETAELPEEIDIERAEAALERAQKALAGEIETDIALTRYEDALERAKNRLRVAQRQQES